jgi:TonB-dependent SusC/RagA subfamily outer membrane receptor
MKKLSLVLGLMLFCIGSIMAQTKVSGNVTDQNGEALLGASVLVKGTSSGTVTDIDGNYSVNVPAGATTLVFSYTGFETQEVEIGGRTAIDVTMMEGVTLTEAIVTALGIERDEKALGYAVQEIDGEDINETRETNIINSLQGKVAGVQIQGSPSSLGGSSRITIRGANSFLGNNQPLFVIDGVPIDNSNFSDNAQARGFGTSTAYDYGNTAQDIDPESVASMTVLKGAAATALYGQRGANGVILITTKDGSGRGKGLGVEVNSSYVVGIK